MTGFGTTTLTCFMCFHSERVVPHQLFTPLLTGMVATGVLLILVLMVLLYKYLQVRKKNNLYETLALVSMNEYV